MIDEKKQKTEEEFLNENNTVSLASYDINTLSNIINIIIIINIINISFTTVSICLRQ